MIDGNALLTDVGSKFGAPMGRMNVTDNLKATVTLFRMRMVDGDYDAGGAYWGSGTPMFAAIGDDFQCYMRANNLEAAKAALLAEYPELTIQTTEVNDDFVDGYIVAMLWSTNDESDPETGGNPLDQNYSRDDIDPELMATIIEDCRKFLEQCGHLLTEENWLGKGEMMENAGHDFWLTRNHHGCGYWDGDWADPAADLLTEASQSKEFGECYIYVGDDGKIYE